MATRQTALVFSVVALVIGLAATAAAQGKKKAASYPGTAVFRCNGTVGCPGSTEPDDGILGQVNSVNDGTYRGTGTPEAGRGAHLRVNSGDTNHEMWIGLRDGFQVLLKIGPLDPLAPCRTAPNNYCEYPGAFGVGVESVVIGATSYAEIQTDVVDGVGSTPTLLDLPIDTAQTVEPAPVRLLIAFNDSSGRLWNFNFSDARNSGAENASVWRTGECTWVITDNESHAELSTLTRVSGRQFRSFEGIYAAPFQITFNAPRCTGQ
jgi:hypothetical protein